MYPQRQLPRSRAFPGLPGQVGAQDAGSPGAQGSLGRPPGVAGGPGAFSGAGDGHTFPGTLGLTSNPPSFLSLCLSFSPAICVSFHCSSPAHLSTALCIVLSAKLSLVPGT